jgi:hypothetical protein
MVNEEARALREPGYVPNPDHNPEQPVQMSEHDIRRAQLEELDKKQAAAVAAAAAAISEAKAAIAETAAPLEHSEL